MSKTKDRSPKVHQGEKVKFELNIKEFPWTEKQKQLIDLILDKKTKIIFINGPAGTSKTLVGIYAGLKLLNEKKVSDIMYVRTAIESSSKSVGYLPGEQADKIAPYSMPLIDKLDELLSRQETDKLLKEGKVNIQLVNFLRGASINVKYLIFDEYQNADFKELTTVITRFGKFSKFIFCGDLMQCDLKKDGGAGQFMNLFNDNDSKTHGIHVFNFTKDDILRSEELKFIVSKLDGTYTKDGRIEPMFPPN